MSYISNYILDSALSKLDVEGNRLDICSQEPTTYTAAITTYSLGNKTSLNIGSPGDRTPSGRKVTVSAITDGVVTTTGVATHWAITDTTNSRLLASGTLTTSQTVTNGNAFTTQAFDIGIPAPS